MARRNCVAVDIGYSNVKISFGDKERDGKPNSILFPAGVVRADEIGEALQGSKTSSSTLVEVGGVEYCAGVNQENESVERILNENYKNTDEYKALYLAALNATGMTEIDTLVTGLPSIQYVDDDYRKDLKRMLTGTFTVNGKSITVHKVKVAAQPVGAFTRFAFESENREIIRKAKILVLDNGFFSFDWVLISQGNLEKKFCSSSTNAVSVLLQRAAEIFKQKEGKAIQLERIETALRDGSSTVLVGIKSYPIAEIINQAAKEIAAKALTEVKNNLRKSKVDPDVMLLAGGGAYMINAIAREQFPGVEIKICPEPVFANSNGFFYLA